MKRVISIITLLFFIITSGLFAESGMKNKFDWIRSARIFLLDAYNYPFFPKIEFDAEELAEALVDMHVNTIRAATGGKYYLIPGTQFETSPYLGERDILAEIVSSCKFRGIRVVPYLQAANMLQTAWLKKHHRDWAQQVNPQGDMYVTRMLAGGPVSTVCWNTPYREAFFDLVEKVMSRYDIDGMYFDTWRPMYFFPAPKVCYCPGCRKGFKEAIGLDLPYRENADEYTPEELEVINKYHTWYNEILVEVFDETKRIIKRYKNIPMIFNVNHAAKLAYKDLRIVNGTDAFLYEMSNNILRRAEGISLAVSHGMAIWPYIGGYDGWQRIVHNGYEYTQQIYTTVAFGGSPILAQFYFWISDPSPEGRKPVKEAFGLLDKNNGCIKGFYPEKFCAVVWNDKDPPGHVVQSWLHGDIDARSCSQGAFAACLYNHIQVTSFLKEDLNDAERLGQYKVLYLPDICYLSDTQIANIKKFVRNGGGLVMTYSTSLYNKNGSKQTDFALGDIAGIEYLNPDEKMYEKIYENYSFGGTWDLYMKTRPGQQVIKSPLKDKLIPMHIYEPVRVLDRGKVVADIVTGTDSKPIFPGLVVSEYGKGKIAYIPAAVDAIYLHTHVKQFGDFLSDVIDYVSSDRIPYEIDAPSSLIANMTSNGDKRVLHLVNWTGCKMEKPKQNVYYIPPVENVTIRYNIPEEKRIKNVSLFVPAKYSFHDDKNTLYITLPRIKEYQGVIIEME